MKVALCHDWLTGHRGGERVLEVFCELFPQAPVYTLVHHPGTAGSVIESHRIQTSFLNKFPGIKKHYRKFLPFFPLACSKLHIKEDVDLVLSSSHCVIKGVSVPSAAKHIAYIHSPMRYMYDQFDNYFGQSAPWAQRVFARCLRPYLQSWDQNSNSQIDVLVANSKFVQKRIENYYGLHSEVIYPFVDLVDFKEVQDTLHEKKKFYLMVSAFAPNKRVDLAIEAFNRLGLPLFIVGQGQQEEYLKSIAKRNIVFLPPQTRRQVVHLMAQAQAFIFPGVEDFGITPLEALAAGTPVVALKKGGALETLNEDVAVFFENESVDDLFSAVQCIIRRNFDREVLKKRAKCFTKFGFKMAIEDLVKRTMEKD